MSSFAGNDYYQLTKIAQYWYDYAIGEGVTGITSPSVNDTDVDLLKKITLYTAKLV